MKIDLKEYFDRRDQQTQKLLEPGPVITLSRDFGCRANEIAQHLINEIRGLATVRYKPHPWKILNKEFLSEAAHALQRKPHELEHILQPHDKSLLEDFVASYSRDYVDDKKALRNIKELVASYAQKGNLIIVGRAGVAVTHSMVRSLHVKLEAPLAWRIDYLKKSRDLSTNEAEELIQQMDHRRQLFIAQMRQEPYEDSLFDVTFNRATLSTEAIVKSILQLLETKKII